MATVNFIKYRKQSAFTLRGVIQYACQKSKTLLPDGCRLITGVNCCAETAVSEFLSTKAQHKKTGDTQFYHYTQSFKVGENISPQTAHKIALEFAQKNYPNYEVLVATHIDAAHIHSHLIVNSVSFVDGKKLHQPPDTLRKLRLSSDEICQAHGFDTLPIYTFGRSKTPSRAQRRAQTRGNSWKDNLQQAIDDAMRRRSGELSALFKRLYEDNVLGRVTNEQFRMLSSDYNAEQKALEEAIPEKESRLENLKASAANVDAFIEKAKRYTTIDELTPELLRLFIQRIEVGERGKKHSHSSGQSIRIIYRDIGTTDSAMDAAEQQPHIAAAITSKDDIIRLLA